MEMNDFINNFINIFDEIDASQISPESKFKEIYEWGSMSVLSLIAMADEEYGVELEPEDIRKAQTVQDLFEIIKSKK